MMDIVAGERTGRQSGPVLVEVFDVGSVPGHVRVVRDWGRDEEVYAEPGLSGVELLGLAAEDAAEAHMAGLLGGPGLDQVALHRARRRARRQDVAAALRTAPVGGGVA